MKNILYCAAVFFILVGCGPDSDPPLPVKPYVPPIITFPELHLMETKNMLPLDKITNGAKVVYVNQYGDEKTLFISVEHGIHKQTLVWEDHGHKKTVDYQAEYFKIGLIDSIILNRTPYILLTMDYGPTGKYAEVITAGLAGGSYFPHISIESTGRLWWGDVVGSYDLNGHNYQNVYTSLDHQAVPASYSRLYYNYELGIIAFEGYSGYMWALDRFEN